MRFEAVTKPEVLSKQARREQCRRRSLRPGRGLRLRVAQRGARTSAKCRALSRRYHRL